MHKALNLLRNIDSGVYLAKREPILISVLEGIVLKNHCNTSFLAVNYHPKIINLILPHCFLTNLVETFISGSKIVTGINGKILPGHSNTNYRKWMNDNRRVKKQ